MRLVYTLFLLFTFLLSAPAAAQLTVTGPSNTLTLTNNSKITADGSVTVEEAASITLAGTNTEIDATTIIITENGTLQLVGSAAELSGGNLAVTEDGIFIMNGVSTRVEMDNLAVGTNGLILMAGDNSVINIDQNLLVDEDGLLASRAANSFISADEAFINDGGELNNNGGGQVYTFTNFDIQDGGVFKTRGYTEVTDINWNGQVVFLVAGDASTNDFGRVYSENNIINFNGELVTELANGYEPTTNQRYRLIELDLQFTDASFIATGPDDNWSYDREQNYVDAIFDATSLPVEWLGFSGRWQGKSAQLDWETATETGSDFFEVQRRNASGSWDEIGTVAAAGESLTPNSYTFTDQNPGPTNPVLYRLRQVDLDGSSVLSDIVSLRRGGDAPGISVFPNPTSDHIFVDGMSVGKFQITDAVGRQIASGNIAEDGRFRIALPTNLAVGTYVLRTEQGDAVRFSVAR